MTKEVGRTEMLQGEKTKGTLVLSAPADVWFHRGCCPGFGTRTEAEGQSHSWGAPGRRQSQAAALDGELLLAARPFSS